MKIAITNLFTSGTKHLEGNPLEVEEQLRILFKGLLDFVPHGDLQRVLEVVERMHGFALSIEDSTDFTPPKRMFMPRPRQGSDPWVREGDFEGSWVN